MLKSSIESLEGKQTLGVLLAGACGIYYILRGHKPELPPIDEILQHVDDAVELAQVYSSIYSSNTAETTSGYDMAKAFDFGAVSGILAMMYKVFGNFNTGRVDLKKEEMELKKEEVKLKKEEIKLRIEEVRIQTQVVSGPEISSDKRPKF